MSENVSTDGYRETSGRVDALALCGIAELAPLISAREISPVELVSAMLARVERLDPWLKAFITVTPERAHEDARRAKAEIAAGRYLGPLHGIPIAHKDVYDTAGVSTTASCGLYVDRIPGEDAGVVARWRTSGAISLGKTSTYELATGREHGCFGIPRNPWAPDRVTGGSSSGSAAGLAAGLFFGASGTDGGGSIRAPAALCGIVGMRPTFGAVSSRGVLGSPSSTTCCGPLARSVRDVALLLQPLLDHDPRDQTLVPRPGPVPDCVSALEEGVRGVRVGVLHGPSFDRNPAHPEIADCFDRAVDTLQELGAVVVDVRLPHAGLTEAIYEVIAHAEMAVAYRAVTTDRLGDLGFSTRVALESGRRITAEQYLLAQRLRTLVEHDFQHAFEQVDVLVSPTSLEPAGTPNEDIERRAHPRRPVSLSGGPSISLPCGRTAAGLPVGLQIAGRPWEEATVLRVAYSYEVARGAAPFPDILPQLKQLEGEHPTALEVRPRQDPVDEAVADRAASMAAALAAAGRSSQVDDVAPAVRYRPREFSGTVRLPSSGSAR